MSQDFNALLEPFYDGKSLTDPISTARVGRLDADYLAGHR